MQFDVQVDNALEQLNQEQVKFEENYSYGYGGYYSRGGWFDDDFYFDDYKDSRSETKDEGLYDFINRISDRFSNEEFQTMIELLDENEKAEWSKGYKAGRESLDTEISLREEVAFKKGYDEGVEDMMDTTEIAN
jgi:hypothetical protein